MAYADTLRSATFTGDDIADLIEGFGVAGHPLDWTNWTPSSYGASGSMTFTSVTVGYARYIQIGKLVLCMVWLYGTIGGTPSTDVYLNGFPVNLVTTRFPEVTGRVDASAAVPGLMYVNGANQLAARAVAGTNWTAGATRYVIASGLFRAS